MNIIPINRVTNVRFSSNNTETTHFTEEHFASLKEHKDLIEALHIAGVVTKSNLDFINKSLEEKAYTDYQTMLQKVENEKRLEKETKLKESMEYIINNITHLNITETSLNYTSKIERQEYDEWTYGTYDALLQDKKFEEALSFVRDNGGNDQYEKLYELYNREVSGTTKEKDMEQQLIQMAAQIKKRGVVEVDSSLHEKAKTVSYKNPYTSFKNLLAELEFPRSC